MHLNRRYFFLGSLALGSGCVGKRPQMPAHRVSIAKAANYSVDLEAIIRRILIDHKTPVAGKRVLLKPNLVEFSPDAPVNTNPVFVSAVASAFAALGASSVQIAEGPGHRRMTLDMAEAAGYFEAVPQFERSFNDLNLDEVTLVKIRNPKSTLTELYLPNTLLSADLLVSLPKMKTHHWAGATLSMKNLFGIVPGSIYGWPKNILHWAGIHESIADLHALFPKHFSLVDGIEGMDGNGPILGNRKPAGVIVGGSHPPSVDATCCQLMRIDPEKVQYLQLVRKELRPYAASIRQTGETIKSVQTTFELLPQLNYLRLNS